MSWMGRVRLIRADGTCEHYPKVKYLNKFCGRCSCWYLACPICRPMYCPICREEMGAVIKAGIEAKILTPQQFVKRLDLKKKAWRRGYNVRKRLEAADLWRENILDLRENVKNLQAKRDG